MAKYLISGEYRYGQCPACKSTGTSMVLRKDGTYTCFACGLTGTIKKKTAREEAAVVFDADRLYDINEAACVLFQEDLESSYGKRGKEYLERRGLTPECVSAFRLGFASSGVFVEKTLKSKGFSDDELVRSGLFGVNEQDGSLWFRLKNRVTYPVCDKEGRIIGFSGRVLDNSEPKYKNSPETEIFRKRENLFAWDKAVKSEKKYLILCEGQMDVISMHQAGFTNAVASLGTALTNTQAELMRSYCENVVVLYDTDDAGVKATLRAIPILEQAGLNVYTANAKPFKDPDELIKQCGRNAMQEKLKKMKPALWYRLQRAKTAGEWCDILLAEKIEKAEACLVQKTD